MELAAGCREVEGVEEEEDEAVADRFGFGREACCWCCGGDVDVDWGMDG